MIKIYKLNNQVAGWIDLAKSEFDVLGSSIDHDGSFELDITLADGQTLDNIDVINQTADVITIPVPSEEELAAQAVRQQRNQLLLELDAIVSNPLRWNSLTQAQHAAYAVYRQDLLDIPQQPGFPMNVTWPTKP